MSSKIDKRRRFLRRATAVLELFFAAAILVCPRGTAAVKFNLSTLTLGNLKLIGDAHLKNGSIRLSRDLPVPNSGAGRALFAEPVRLRHPTTSAVIPFSTFFSFSVVNLNPSSIGGGLAFLLAADESSLGDPGGFLGLISPSAADPPPIIAVEFDTFMDAEFDDINDNHVGLDLNTMVSAEAANLSSAGIDLKSGKLVNAWIEYNHSGVLQVFISYSTIRPLDPILAYPIDLTQFVGEFMFVGFSGSTQGSTEIHSIEWWSFSSSSSNVFPKYYSANPPAAISPAAIISEGTTSKGNIKHKKGEIFIVASATATAFFIAACSILCFWAAISRRAKTVKKGDFLAATAETVKIPREFSYRELHVATLSFNSARIIGHGAFGTVYKGIIPSTGEIIAVKRCINGEKNGHSTSQAKSEFLSELSIIASLRHRNLVRLQGWCNKKGEILLVYDYMRHGSLDKALFTPSSPALPWRLRRKILAGVASALSYLHHECDRQIIHRDVKSSNVMLDEDFHARLTDFGLARQIDHDRSPDATVTAGTMGYLAPEYLITGRASDKTDVYSFGALVLEVVSGRRPIDERRRGSLVEWIWGLHGEGRLMEAVDPRMEGKFGEKEMRRVLLVGLGCSSPDAVSRPGMRNVVQMFGGEEEPPHVPLAKPTMSFRDNQQLIITLQDSVSDYNDINGINSSSSSSSLTSILRGGGGGGDDAGG